MLSFVIPVYNEAQSLSELHAELDGVARAHGYDREIVFVDDGSTDDSWETIRQLAARDPRVRGLRFRRNFGKAAALNAGFREVGGEVVFTLDGDLQDDPQEIPRFLEQLAAGRDLVSGWKQVRHDPWHKIGPSRVFNWLVSTLSGVWLHDHNCGFKCYRRAVLEELVLYGERHRFVPVLAAARGWRVGEIIVNHRPRRHGYSKFGVSRFVKGFLDLWTVAFLTRYGLRPQHALGTAGLVCLGCGAVGLAGALLWQVVGWWPLTGDWATSALGVVSVAVMLLGAQLLTAGVVAELVTAHHMRAAVPYTIQERTTPAGPARPGREAVPDTIQEQPAGTPTSAAAPPAEPVD